MKSFWMIIIAFFFGYFSIIGLVLTCGINELTIILLSISLSTFIIATIIITISLKKTSQKLDRRINAIYNDTNNQLDNIEEFFYESRYNLEKKRKTVVFVLLKIIIVVITWIILYITGISINSSSTTFLFSTPLIFLFLLFLVLMFLLEYDDKRKSYSKYYKETIINDLLKYIDTSIEYNPDGDEDDFERFLSAGFVEPSYYLHTISDRIFKNDIDKTLILNKIELRTLRGKRANNVVDLFIFAYFTINQDILSNICIQRNSKLNDKPINKDNFDEYFISEYDLDINNKNKLIEDINKEIIEYYNKYAIDLNIKIINNSIFIKFYTENILEAPSIFLKVSDKNTFKSNYSAIKGIIEFCDRLRKTLEEDLLA